MWFKIHWGLSRKNSYTRTYFGNKFLSFVFSKLYKIKVTDIATCLKIFKYELLQKFELNTNGFEIEVELISKSFRFTDKYGEVPISYSGRKYNQGKKIKTSDGFKYLYYMLKFLLK